MTKELPKIILHNLFKNKALTLSCAESCTGGSLSARLTLVPGCSEYFLGSVIAYSNEVKMNLSGVEPSTIQQFGAVSAEVVQEMASGMIELTGSDYSVSVCGIAGPSRWNNRKTCRDNLCCDWSKRG